MELPLSQMAAMSGGPSRRSAGSKSISIGQAGNGRATAISSNFGTAALEEFQLLDLGTPSLPGRISVLLRCGSPRWLDALRWGNFPR